MRFVNAFPLVCISLPQAQNDEIACVKELLRGKVKDLPDTEGRTAMMWAAGKGSVRALDALIAAGGDVAAVDSTGGSALHIAAFTGHSECARVLLQHKANINTLDNTKASPLMRACEAGHSELVIDLIHGASAGQPAQQS